MNVLGALDMPKGITSHSYKPSGVLKAAINSSFRDNIRPVEQGRNKGSRRRIRDRKDEGKGKESESLK
ncbi:unnamed protein product [Prunus brigantina]